MSIVIQIWEPFISPVIFGYVTFHSFVFTFSFVVSIVWFSFFRR